MKKEKQTERQKFYSICITESSPQYVILKTKDFKHLASLRISSIIVLVFQEFEIFINYKKQFFQKKIEILINYT